MNDAKRNKLWEEYSKTKSYQIREKLIIEYAPLLKIVAGRLSMYLGHNVEYDDLVGYGTFGLIDAIDKFDYSKGIKFETYASLRIRGSILDQIRKMDWIPRTLRQKQKKIDNAHQELEKEYSRAPKDEEMAQKLEITVDEYIEWQNQTKLTSLVSLDEFVEQGGESTVEPIINTQRFEEPEEAIGKEELRRKIAEALEKLTPKEKKVVILYYYEDLTLKEISKILEVSESRISQLHTKALQKLKIHLGSYINILTGI